MDVERNVVYGMVSGLALLMDVYRPEAPNGYGIVYVNGSGWHAPLAYDAVPLKETPLGMPYIHAMRDAGYAVFAVNHRQAPRFRYPAAVEDVQRAVRFVRHHADRFGIRADRIGACGGSSGGHLVSLLGTLPGDGDPADIDPINHESARVQCVVARAAITDLATCAGYRVEPMIADFLGMLLSKLEGAPRQPQEEATYRDSSPLHQVSANSAPFLLIHGDKDATVPFEQSERMLTALSTAGVRAELLRIPGAGHGPSFPGAVNPPDYLGATVSWFDEHLRAG
jgi:acetyl esterase/lipase